MLQSNTSATGSLNVDAFQRAMLIYRNSIDPETKASPAMILYGRPIRDPIPAPLGKYCPHQTWQETLENREKALAIRHSREKEKWTEHTRELQPLDIGDHVYVQNLVGNNPRRWERTGIVIEILPHKQYRIKLDGTGRVTLRNRKGLRKFTPFFRKNAVEDRKNLVEMTRPSTRNSNKSEEEEKKREVQAPTPETDKEKGEEKRQPQEIITSPVKPQPTI